MAAPAGAEAVLVGAFHRASGIECARVRALFDAPAAAPGHRAETLFRNSAHSFKSGGSITLSIRHDHRLPVLGLAALRAQVIHDGLAPGYPPAPPAPAIQLNGNAFRAHVRKRRPTTTPSATMASSSSHQSSVSRSRSSGWFQPGRASRRTRRHAGAAAAPARPARPARQRARCAGGSRA